MAQLQISADATLRQALEQLGTTARGILLLVGSDGTLLRTITDGDLRRLLLDGADLDDTIAALPDQAPVTLAVGWTARSALALMNERSIHQLPVVDDANRPVELVLRSDIDTPILLSTPHMSDLEQDFVAEAFETNWVAPLGPNVDAFEVEMAEYLGAGAAAALSSGTAAIHLGLRLLGVESGDTVFCSDLTFVASVNPVRYQGAEPVFIDSEPESWNMSPSALAEALDDAKARGTLPKAVIVVDLYGQSADFDPIAEISETHGVPILEDAAESLGATYKGRASGTFGRVGALSFNGNKIITSSGGGMLVADDEALMERARHLATQARAPAPHYEHTEIGYNYRMSNVLAGVGRGQLRVLDERVDARRDVFARYEKGLGDIEGVAFMPEAEYGRSNRWLSVMTLDPSATPLTPSRLIASLSEDQIEARHVWKPMHMQPLYADRPLFTHDSSGAFSARAFAQGVCLPSGSNMTVGQQDRVITAIHRAFERC
ncbi:MAG: aminotransferase class I/II-fold pyridoxal phosphate-dependent enzyme [Acidimicrobiia bacterium]|nr:aminotransferase class I/II-fold pyridoxal phosphate-dependent enzyme [Acidimicrobiia bacterium]